MFDFDENSIEAARVRLQDMGLTLNEIKQMQGQITNEAYADLLEFTICLLDDIEEYTKKVQRLKY